MDKYTTISRIGEGSHGVVLKGICNDSGELVALKKIPIRKLEEGIPEVVLREIMALKVTSTHQNIVRLREVFPHGFGFTLVFDFMSSDLSEILRNLDSRLYDSEIKAYMVMLLRGVEFLHFNGIMHRDLKPANLLVHSSGVLKIADFGLARLFSKDVNNLYSHQVATRWYRAPELLYGSRDYTESIDMWAVGCIFGELINNSPLFPGENDIEQLWLLIRIFGTPTEKNWPGIARLPDYNKIRFTQCKPVALDDIILSTSPLALNLLEKFLRYDHTRRISATKALMHEYFLMDSLPADQNRLRKPSARRYTLPSLEDCLRDPLHSMTPPLYHFVNALAF